MTLMSSALTATGTVALDDSGNWHLRSTNSYNNHLRTNPEPVAGKWAQMEVVSIDTRDGAQLNLELHDPANAGQVASWRAVGDGTLRMSMDGMTQVSIPRDPVRHRWLRVGPESEGGDMVWSTSPDGVTWTERHRFAETLALGNVRIQVFSYCPTPSTTAEAVVRNVNQAPTVAGATLTADRVSYQPGETITLTLGGGATASLTQTTGIPVPLSGSGTRRTGEAPWTLRGGALTFVHTVVGSPTPATAVVLIEPAQLWMVGDRGWMIPASEEMEAP